MRDAEALRAVRSGSNIVLARYNPIATGAQLVALGTDLTMFANSCRSLREAVETVRGSAVSRKGKGGK